MTKPSNSKVSKASARKKHGNNTEKAAKQLLVVHNGQNRDITTLGLEAVATLAAAGCSRGSIAKALGISRHGLDNLSKRDERVQEAFDLGRAELETELTSLLMQSARQGNVTAAIYLTKSMHNWSDQAGKSAAAEVKAPAVNVTVVNPMTPEAFQAFINTPKADVIDNEPTESPKPKGVIK